MVNLNRQRVVNLLRRELIISSAQGWSIWIGGDWSIRLVYPTRKSFGRRVWENNERSERGLIMLNEILNHTSIKTTKIYLGIRDKEIQDIYQNL